MDPKSSIRKYEKTHLQAPKSAFLQAQKLNQTGIDIPDEKVNICHIHVPIIFQSPLFQFQPTIYIINQKPSNGVAFVFPH